VIGIKTQLNLPGQILYAAVFNKCSAVGQTSGEKHFFIMTTTDLTVVIINIDDHGRSILGQFVNFLIMVPPKLYAKGTQPDLGIFNPRLLEDSAPPKTELSQ